MKTRILVVDDSISMTELIEEYFLNNSSIEIVKSLHNGEEAVEEIKNNVDSFDILLLDLIMPRKDGIYVLDYMKSNKIKKDVIVMSSYNEDSMIRRISEYGVKFYALKPFDLSDIEYKINSIINSKKINEKLIDYGNKDIQVTITKLLHSLGIPSSIKGYQYIRSAITMVFENPKLIGGITKELYPDLSVKYNTSTQRVERAIRHAIEVSWLRGDIDLMEEIFGHSVDIDKAKPTNSEFIVTIADKLRLEMINI